MTINAHSYAVSDLYTKVELHHVSACYSHLQGGLELKKEIY
jgi:hypothetical protein